MGKGPLSGVRVIELAGIGPGPFAAMLLADLGADVIRVDRASAVRDGAASGGTDFSNRGKRSIAIDLKSERGKEVVLRLAEKSDVLLEGFRPGVTERLGIGPDDCLARNPKLVYGRMTGWGQEGPLSPAKPRRRLHRHHRRAARHRPRRRPPQVPMNLLGDFTGTRMPDRRRPVRPPRSQDQRTRPGRRRRDRGRHRAPVHLHPRVPRERPLAGPPRRQHARHRRPWYDVYETADGRHMAVGAIESQFYAEFLRRLGLDGEDLPDQNDQSAWPVLRERFAAVFKTKTRDEWTEVFVPSDACVAPVLSMNEAAEHPYNTARDVFPELANHRQPAPAPRFSRTTTSTDGVPALPGGQTRAILDDLGFDDTETLLKEGAVTQA